MVNDNEEQQGVEMKTIATSGATDAAPLAEDDTKKDHEWTDDEVVIENRYEPLSHKQSWHSICQSRKSKQFWIILLLICTVTTSVVLLMSYHRKHNEKQMAKQHQIKSLNNDDQSAGADKEDNNFQLDDGFKLRYGSTYGNNPYYRKPAPTCYDGKKNSRETDKDCGGNCSPRKKCADGQSCKVCTDCKSDVCIRKVCLPAHCINGFPDAGETDIDCGGTCASRKKCLDGRSCGENPDCMSNICTNQLCETMGLCSLEDRAKGKSVVSITFGEGIPLYSSVPIATYGFTSPYAQLTAPVGFGRMSIMNAIDSTYAFWHGGEPDHTLDSDPASNKGYMLLFDAKAEGGELLQYTLVKLCVGERYEISMFIANYVKAGALLGSVKPNIRFEVRTAAPFNIFVASKDTGEIPEYPTLTWNEYGFSFFAPADSVVLRMTLLTPGLFGNDFAIDDFTVRSCSPSISDLPYR